MAGGKPYRVQAGNAGWQQQSTDNVDQIASNPPPLSTSQSELDQRFKNDVAANQAVNITGISANSENDENQGQASQIERPTSENYRLAGFSYRPTKISTPNERVSAGKNYLAGEARPSAGLPLPTNGAYTGTYNTIPQTPTSNKEEVATGFDKAIWNGGPVAAETPPNVTNSLASANQDQAVGLTLPTVRPEDSAFTAGFEASDIVPPGSRGNTFAL